MTDLIERLKAARSLLIGDYAYKHASAVDDAIAALAKSEEARLKEAAGNKRRGIKIIEMAEQIGLHMMRAEAAEASLSQALARIEELEKALEWRTMESAPKNGTEILVRRNNDCFYEHDVVWWSVQDKDYPWATNSGGRYAAGRLDEWRPLPATPIDGGKG